MTNAELAELRGQIYGLEVILANCLAVVAAITDDPEAHLDAIQHQAIAGIAQSTNDQVKTAHLRTYQAAAAGVVLKMVEAAKKAMPQVSIPHRLQ